MAHREDSITAEEYNSLNGDETGLQANMRRPFCEYMIHNTAFHVLTTLTYLCANTMSSTSSWTNGLAWDYNAMVRYNICLKQQLFHTCFLTPRSTRKLHSLVHIFCTVATSIFNTSGECIQHYPGEARMLSLAVQLGCIRCPYIPRP